MPPPQPGTVRGCAFQGRDWLGCLIRFGARALMWCACCALYRKIYVLDIPKNRPRVVIHWVMVVNPTIVWGGRMRMKSFGKTKHRIVCA